MRPVTIVALLLATAALAVAAPARSADALRGRALYDARCSDCHDTSVHGRDKRAAANFEELRGWVAQWAANLGLKWTDAEVTDVAVHLNARYYRFACPPVHCKATGSLDAGAGRLALDGRRP